MVAALDSKSSLARGGSSSLPPGTMQNKSLSYIEISKDNLINNIKQFRGLLKGDTKIAAVVKANAYGHGDIEVVKIASPYVDYFQVDSIEEAERVRGVSKKPILIFGYLNEDGIKRSVKINAIVCAFDLIGLLKINHIAFFLMLKMMCCCEMIMNKSHTKRKRLF